MKRAIVGLLAILSGCGGAYQTDPPPSCAKVYEDLADWRTYGTVQAQAKTDCGRTEGYTVHLQAGQSWTLERTVPARKGLPVNLRASASAHSAAQWQASISTPYRVLTAVPVTNGSASVSALSEGGEVTVKLTIAAKTVIEAKVEKVLLWFD